MADPMKLITLGTAAGNSSRQCANASNLIQCGGKIYLIDAGDPVKALLFSRKIPYTDVPCVFITHTHEDHIGGIIGLLNCFFRNPALVPEEGMTVYLPEMAAKEPILGFLKAVHRDVPEGKLHFLEVTPGVFFDDGNLKITAFRTNHFLKPETGVSYAFLLEHGPKRLVITSDLHNVDFADFPKAAFDKEADCLCEAVHGSLETLMQIVRTVPVRKLILTHYKQRYLHEDHALFEEQTKGLPFPVVLARDDDEFEGTSIYSRIN